MARPRKPTSILKLSGSLKRNPDRFKDRTDEPVCTKSVGKPPAHLTKLQKNAFSEIVKLSIDGVLTEADRLAIEQAAKLLVKCRGQHIENDEIKPATFAEQNLFFKYLSQFGMLPADRSKISIPKQKETNPFDD